MQPARRRPHTYGKKSQSHTFARGLESLSDKSPPKSPPKTPSKLHMPAASPAKARRPQPLSPSDPFDVPSSGDELSPNRRPKSSLKRRPASPQPQSERTKRSRSAASSSSRRSPAPIKPRAAVNGATTRKRLAGRARANTTRSPSSTGSPMKISSPVFTPRTPLTATPEPDWLPPRTPDTQVRKAASTPKQDKLWTDLLDGEEPSSHGPATELRNLSLLSSTARTLQSATATLSHKSPSGRLVDRLMPSEDSELLYSDDNTTMQSEDDIDDTEQLREALDSSFLQPAPPMPRTTYAQQRTYLEDDTSFEALLAQPLDDGIDLEPPQKQVGSFQKSTSGFDFPDDDEEVGPGVRSVHELRAGGDAKRFDDEVRRLLEDVVDSPDLTISSQRSGILTIASRLEEKPFRQRFVQGSYEHQFFKNCVRNDDVICSVAFAAAVTFLLHGDMDDGRAAAHALHSIPIRSLQPALGSSKDLVGVARDRQTNMSKLAQKSVAEFQGMLAKSGLFGNGDTYAVSPQHIALKAMDLLVRRSRAAGNVECLLNPSQLDQLIRIGRSTLPNLREAVAASTLRDVLSILESSTVATSRGTDSSIWTPDVVVSAIPLLEAAIGPTAAYQESIRPLGLKLCLNLTNNSEVNSDAFDASAFVSTLLNDINRDLAMVSSLLAEAAEPHVEGTKLLDATILSLGAMMNLAEMSVLVRRSVEQKQRGAFDSLVEAFIRNRERAGKTQSLSDAALQIAFGYVAILLANLAQNSRLRARIVAKLPNGNVGVLVQAVEEFIGHNQEADRQSHEGPEWVAFTRRLQAVVDSLKEVVNA